MLVEQLSLSQAKDIATLAGAVIAALTFLVSSFLGISEYLIQGVQKRVEHFIALRKNLDEDEMLRQVVDALDDNEDLLDDRKKIPPGNKRYFLAFFEQIALMMNSGLISIEVANYMFGYYAIKCWHTKTFWKNMKQEKNDCHWSLFKDFVKQMEKQDKILRRDTETKSVEIRRTYLRGKVRYRPYFKLWSKRT